MFEKQAHLKRSYKNLGIEKKYLHSTDAEVLQVNLMRVKSNIEWPYGQIPGFEIYPAPLHHLKSSHISR